MVAQTGRANDGAHPTPALVPFDVEGLWDGTAAWEGRFTDSNQRYRGNITWSAFVRKVDPGLLVVWRERATFLSAAGRQKVEYQGAFQLRREENQITGHARSARFRTGNGNWQPLSQVAFTGTSISSSQLRFEIVWQRDASGKESRVSRGSLQRRPNSPAVSTTLELEGLWTGSQEYEDRFTNNNQRYRAKGRQSVEIEGIAGLDGVLRAQWHETRELTYLDRAETLTMEFEATFRLRRNGDQVSASASSARLRFGDGEWSDLSGVPLTGRYISPGQLQVSIVWQRSSRGKVTNASEATLQRQ